MSEITKEQMLECIEDIISNQGVWSDYLPILSSICTRLKEHDALKAEVEELNEALWYWYEVALEYSDMPADRALIEMELKADKQLLLTEKKALEAEVERLKEGNSSIHTDQLLMSRAIEYPLVLARAEKAEAEVEMARPLLEAAVGAEIEIGPDERYWLLDTGHTAQRLLRAAFTYRAKKEEK